MSKRDSVASAGNSSPLARRAASPPGNPERALALGAARRGRPRASREPRAALGGEEAPEVAARPAAAAPKQLLGRGVHARDAQRLVELDDRVHRAVDEARELLLALAHLGLGAQAPQLGGGARGEDVEQRVGARLLRHRPAVEHGQVAEDAAVDVEQRHAQVAHRADLLRPGSSSGRASSTWSGKWTRRRPSITTSHGVPSMRVLEVLRSTRRRARRRARAAGATPGGTP